MPFRDKFAGCPDCNEAMTSFSVIGSKYLVCPKCRGAWVSHPTLLELVRHMRLDAKLEMLSVEDDRDNASIQLSVSQDPPPGDSGRRCPTCNGRLAAQHIENINVDVCDTHGVWFDAEELQSVLYRISSASQDA